MRKMAAKWSAASDLPVWEVTCEQKGGRTNEGNKRFPRSRIRQTAG